MKSIGKLRHVKSEAFTLLDLLVVIGVIALLVALQLPVLADSKSQSKIAVCASNVRQLSLACQIYAADNSNRLPVLSGSASWAWDLPIPVTDALLNSGAQKRTFYCPGTSPRFTDKENWAASGTGSNSSLWNFGVLNNFRIVGYAMAFSGLSSQLAVTNQNATILPDNGTLPSERVLVADATISTAAVLPGYAHPENNYTSITGGFFIPHVSPHLKGNIPIGGNIGFKDGHVAWRKFEVMTPRTTTATTFWW